MSDKATTYKAFAKAFADEGSWRTLQGTQQNDSDELLDQAA